MGESYTFLLPPDIFVAGGVVGRDIVTATVILGQ
jgi:hypothetical protein